MTLPTKMSNVTKKATCPNCYNKGNDIVIANDNEQSEYKPERKE